MPHWLKLATVPLEAALTSDLVFEVLQGKVHGVGFDQAAEVDLLLRAARQHGSEPLLLEAFGCHVVALSDNAAVTDQLHRSGIVRVAQTQEQVLGILLERFGESVLQ